MEKIGDERGKEKKRETKKRGLFDVGVHVSELGGSTTTPSVRGHGNRSAAVFSRHKER